MNRTQKKLKKLEQHLAKRLVKDFGKLKNWHFLGDMHKGSLTVHIHAEEKES